MENLKDKALPIILPEELSDLYKNVNGLSLQNMFYIKNHYFPNCYMFASSARDVDYYFDTNKLLEDIINKYGKLACTVYTTYDFNNKSEQIGINVCLEKQNIYARLENDVSESYILYGHDSYEHLSELLTLVQDCYVPPKSEGNNIWLVATTPNGYCLNKFTVKNVENFDIDKQYNDDLKKQDEKIVQFINNKDKSGIVFLHGEKGTGKTTYIRHLINTTKDVKFVFIQPSMFPLFGEASFTTFMSSLHDSVIILEDCESVVKSRKSGNDAQQSTVSTLLNMSDGLLSDGLGIKFICTFNENIPAIDEALLRKGRLISKYEFKPLCVEKSEKLLKELYQEDVFVVQEPGFTLADIYNIKDETYINERKRII